MASGTGGPHCTGLSLRGSGCFPPQSGLTVPELAVGNPVGGGPPLAEHFNSPGFLWVSGSFLCAMQGSQYGLGLQRERQSGPVGGHETLWLGKPGANPGAPSSVPGPCVLGASRSRDRDCAVPVRPQRPTRSPVLCRSPVRAVHRRQQVGLGEPRQQPLHGGHHARVGGRAPHRLCPGAQARPWCHR